MNCQSAVASQDQLVRNMDRRSRGADSRRIHEEESADYEQNAKIMDVLKQLSERFPGISNAFRKFLKGEDGALFDEAALKIAKAIAENNKIKKELPPSLERYEMAIAWGLGLPTFFIVYRMIGDSVGPIGGLVGAISGFFVGMFGAGMIVKGRSEANSNAISNSIENENRREHEKAQLKLIRAAIVDACPGIESKRGLKSVLEALTQNETGREILSIIQRANEKDDEEMEELMEELIK
jgi:hypothetical protein